MNCETCGQPFEVCRAADPRTAKLVMLIWALRRTVCLDCLLTMQVEFNEAKWAAQQGVPTIR